MVMKLNDMVGGEGGHRHNEMLSRVEANVQQKRMKLAWKTERRQKTGFRGTKERGKKEGRVRVAMRHTETHTDTQRHTQTQPFTHPQSPAKDRAHGPKQRSSKGKFRMAREGGQREHFQTEQLG